MSDLVRKEVNLRIRIVILLTVETDIMMSVWSLNDREIPETRSNTFK